MNQEKLAYQKKIKENLSILIEKEKLVEAKELLAQYEKVEHDDIEIYSIKSVIAMMEGDLDEAERILTAGLTYNPNHFDLNYNMGYVTSMKKSKEKAVCFYEKALENTKNKTEIDEVKKIIKALGLNKEGSKDIIVEKFGLNTEKQIDDNVIIVSTDKMTAPTARDDLYTSRANVYSNLLGDESRTATIVIQGYNRLEKTKYCVECVLNYTKEIDYELILIDNGSDDGTFEFFRSVKYNNKKIIRITKNIGAFFPNLQYVFSSFNSKYLVVIPNDVYVTSNWLTNLLRCMESDKKIGWVMPMSSNISNLQDPGLFFDTMEEMQQKAQEFNKSDPSKWQKRLRLVSPLGIYSKETIDLVGKFDVGFFHDFGEDDYSIRLRRMGYSLILCGDTFVHHDHDFRNLEGKDPALYEQSIKNGRSNFKEKYYELDAWDDFNNFERDLISLLPKPKKSSTQTRILGIDICCGTPILEIENFLMKNNINTISSDAFTTKAKYYLDLKTICEGAVFCDRIEFLDDSLKHNEYDYIIIGEPINKYLKPVEVLETVVKASKQGSKILFKLGNNNDINKLLEIFQIKDLKVDVDYSQLTLDTVLNILKSDKISKVNIAKEMYSIDTKGENKILKIIEDLELQKRGNEIYESILTRSYLFCITI